MDHRRRPGRRQQLPLQPHPQHRLPPREQHVPGRRPDAQALEPRRRPVRRLVDDLRPAPASAPGPSTSGTDRATRCPSENGISASSARSSPAAGSRNPDSPASRTPEPTSADALTVRSASSSPRVPARRVECTWIHTGPLCPPSSKTRSPIALGSTFSGTTQCTVRTSRFGTSTPRCAASFLPGPSSGSSPARSPGSIAATSHCARYTASAPRTRSVTWDPSKSIPSTTRPVSPSCGSSVPPSSVKRFPSVSRNPSRPPASRSGFFNSCASTRVTASGPAGSC